MTIVEHIRQVLAAKADALVRRAGDDLSALIHPAFIYVNASGTVFDKTSYIDTFCVSGKIVFDHQEVVELLVRPFPGFAVAAMVLNDTFTIGGTRVTGIFRSFCVFSETAGRWQWAAGQTMAPAGSATTIPRQCSPSVPE